MTKYTKKNKKEVNIQKEEKKKLRDARKKLLGQRLEKLIDSKYKTRTAFIKACTDISNYNNNSAGELYIKPNQLSDIIHGKAQLPPDRAKVFSEVLGVPAAYLLGYLDHPSEEAREEAYLAEAMDRWDAEDKERIEAVKRVMSLLAERKFIFQFELKEEYEVTSAGRKHKVHGFIASNNMQHVLYTGDSSCILDDVTFFSWLCNNTLTIKIKNNHKAQYYHLSDKIKVLSSDHRWIEIDVNSFMRMIYDIDDSIRNTIQTRCDFWLNYSDYDYKEAFTHEC